MRSTFVVFAVAASTLGFASAASAAMTIKSPNPPGYGVEIEPKLNLSYLGLYGGYGGNAWGPGVRISIPVMKPGFVKSINDTVAISFGADFMRYEGYYYYWCDPKKCPAYYGNYDRSFWAIHLPVTMQWNFFLTDKWSVFAEPGLTIRQSFLRDDPYYGQCDPRFYDCRRRSTDFYFTLFAGGRFHFSDKLALTMRIGHPIDFSVGLSIFL